MANAIGYYVQIEIPASTEYALAGWQRHSYHFSIDQARRILARLARLHVRARIVDSNGYSLQYAPAAGW